MKKLLIFALTACLVFSLAACSAGTANETQGSTAAGTTEPAVNEAFVFTYNGTKIQLHANMAPILAALGEPKSYTESASCAFEGLDKTYYYGSLYIQTNPAPQGDRIGAVWFADDSITTPEGVYIGADRATVEKAYGSFSGDACTLDRDGQRLMILLTDGAVSSIQYTMAQE